MTTYRPLRVLSRWTAGLAAVLLLAPAMAQQEPDAPIAEPQEAPAPEISQEAQTTPSPIPLPPIPDPPRFVSDIVSSISDVNGDLFGWGQSVSLAGDVLNNAFLGGGSTSIDGLVGSDAFTFAQTATVTGEVMHNVYAFAAQMTVTDDAVIHGNLVCFCGSLNLTGTVRGQVLGSGGAATIAGEVGSMKLEVGSLVVAPSAVIHGDLEYKGNKEANISEDAELGGELRWNQDKPDEDEDTGSAAESSWFSFWNLASSLWWYLANLTVGMAFLLFGGRWAQAPVARLREQAAVGLGFGFVVTVVIPVACLIAALMLVTLPLGFIVLQVYLLAVFLARLVTAQFLGDWLLRTIGQHQPSQYLALAGGLVLFFLATEIPYVGFLIYLTALFLGMGGLFLAVRGERPSTVVSG